MCARTRRAAPPTTMTVALPRCSASILRQRSLTFRTIVRFAVVVAFTVCPRYNASHFVASCLCQRTAVFANIFTFAVVYTTVHTHARARARARTYTQRETRARARARAPTRRAFINYRDSTSALASSFVSRRDWRSTTVASHPHD